MNDTPQPTASEMPDGMDGAARTFASARRHSAVVRVLKWTIPAFAATTVVLVIGWSFFNPFGRIPGLTVGPISFSGSKIAMEHPRLTGFRKDGRGYEVTAIVAYQDLRSPNVLELKDMKGQMASDNAGGVTNLVSDEGVFDSGKEHLDLSSNIRIWTAKGEEILMRSAAIDLKGNRAVSHEPVKVRTPTMTVDADSLDASDGGKMLVFAGRVHVNMAGSGGTEKAKRADPKIADAAPETGPAPVATAPAPVAVALSAARIVPVAQALPVALPGPVASLAPGADVSTPIAARPSDTPLPPPAPRGTARSGEARLAAGRPAGPSTKAGDAKAGDTKSAKSRAAASSTQPDGPRYTQAEPAARP